MSCLDCTHIYAGDDGAIYCRLKKKTVWSDSGMCTNFEEQESSDYDLYGQKQEQDHGQNL